MDYDKRRDALLRDLSREVSDERVLSAMSRVPRELFVPKEMRSRAYDNRPLDIGYGQTISQPLIVTMMTEALSLKGTEKVLELGTGSGYQTALLAELTDTVITVERIPELLENARHTLSDLGYRNIEFHAAGDTLGWPQGAPYDAIIVTAGAPAIPEELTVQLRYGGIMVIPVGNRYLQDLCKLVRGRDRNTLTQLGGCRFVSLIGNGAWDN